MARELVDGRVVVSVCKAEPLYHGAPSVRIEIALPLPVHCDLQEADRFYSRQAGEIEQKLWRALPGGTYDRLLGQMLARKATYFRVPHGSGEEG